MLEFKTWLEEYEATKPPTKMKKITKYPLKKSKGVRSHEDDLSSDYKGHLSHNGSVEPWKVVK